MILTLAITYECSKGCGYCFQLPERAFGMEPMSRGNFERALRWLGRSGYREFKMTGGEPTEHPEFLDFCALAGERGMRIVLLTNGRFDFRLLRNPDVLAGAFIHVRPASGPARQPEDRVLESIDILQSAGVPVVLSYTIMEPGGLCEMVRLAHSLRKAALRADIARWDLNRSNAYVDPGEYGLYSREIIEAIGLASSLGVAMNLDCPLPLCMFEEKDRKRLGSSGLRGVCSPFPIVNPDLSVGCCPYPGLLRRDLTGLSPEAVFEGLRQHRALAELRWGKPMFERCEACPLRTARQCQGGCIRGKRSLPDDSGYMLPFRSVP